MVQHVQHNRPISTELKDHLIEMSVLFNTSPHHFDSVQCVCLWMWQNVHTLAVSTHRHFKVLPAPLTVFG